MRRLLFISVILALIATGIAKAGTPVTRAIFMDFSGGMNDNASPMRLGDNEWTNLTNVRIDKFGEAIRRNGYVKVTSTQATSYAAALGLYCWKTPSDSTYVLYAFNDGVYYLDGSSWSELTDDAAFSTTGYYDFAEYDSELIFVNGSEYPQRWSGGSEATTLSADADLKKAEFCETFENYLMLAKDSTNKSRVWWSKWATANGSSDWDALNYIDVNPGADYITGMAVLGTRLIVFKRDSFYAIDFTGASSPTFYLTQLNNAVGCVANRSIVDCDGVLIWLARHGVYAFDGSNLTCISDKIQTTLEACNTTRFNQAVAVHDREHNQYWLSLPSSSSTYNDTTLVYHYRTNAWVKYSQIYAGAYATYNGSTKFDLVYSAESRSTSAAGGYVYYHDSTNYDGDGSTTIPMTITTKWVDGGDPVMWKMIQNMYVFAREVGAYNIQAYYSFDWSDDTSGVKYIDMSAPGALWDTGIWDAAEWGRTAYVPKSVMQGQRVRAIQLKLYSTGAHDADQITGVGLEIQPLSAPGGSYDESQ